ncbi:MAG TPA: AAA family ATPase [Chitinophagaceae bacterium]|nr:AAA family ATPase [Chitinophagaceae bacterium]
MISKIEIKGVGKFRHSMMEKENFSEKTLIYGANTAGKSTLTDIFWSFKTGNAHIIQGRRTFGYNGNQHVQITDENATTYQFPGADWSKGYPLVEIFDAKFINDNIFEGEAITFDHQKKLNQIVIGARGMALNQQINELQVQLNNYTAQKMAKSKLFSATFKRDITLDDFIKLPRMKDAEQQLTEMRSTIETAMNQSKIREAFSIIDQQLKSILQQNTKEKLSQNIEVKAELVSEHLKNHWSNPKYSKDFIQTGLTLTREGQECCVFCGQGLGAEAKELLNAYATLFSKEYRQIQQDVQLAAAKFSKWNPLETIRIIQSTLKEVGINDFVPEINTEDIVEMKEYTNLEFQFKSRDLAYRADFTGFDQLLDIFRVILFEIEKIKDKKIFTADVNVLALQQAMRRIELCRLRHSDEWQEFIDEYHGIDQEAAGIKVKREKLRDELQKYSEVIFSIHLDTINQTLRSLGADFILNNFKPIKKLVGKAERIFTLHFFNTHQVNIDESSVNRPNFNNTLSESDKQMLAFAFFYSLMIHDPNLDKKVVVFDDPFSSFDIERRKALAEKLAAVQVITSDGELIEKKMGQLLLLTHEIEFYQWICEKWTDSTMLTIAPDGEYNGIKKSNIVTTEAVYA